MGDGYRSDEDAARARAEVLQDQLAEAAAENDALRARVASLEARARRSPPDPPRRQPVSPSAQRMLARQLPAPERALLAQVDQEIARLGSSEPPRLAELVAVRQALLAGAFHDARRLFERYPRVVAPRRGRLAPGAILAILALASFLGCLVYRCGR